MKYQLQQKLMAMGDDFSIKDHHGREIYYVDGKVFSFGKKLQVLDRNKNEVAMIRRKLFTIRPTFTISSRGRLLATVYKKLFTFRKAFVIDVPGPDDITVVGKLLEHEYKFYRDNKEIAVVSKGYFRASDTYGVDIHSHAPAHTKLILCAAVTIDLMAHPKRDSSFE